MGEIKFDIIFWDSINPKTIEHISIEEAYRENYIEVKNNTIIPTDECTIIRQFTGLKDKNGINIYEGDILDNKTEVKFSKEQACFWCGTVPLCMRNSHREIIGNIHQNPELINNQ